MVISKEEKIRKRDTSLSLKEGFFDKSYSKYYIPGNKTTEKKRRNLNENWS